MINGKIFLNSCLKSNCHKIHVNYNKRHALGQFNITSDSKLVINDEGVDTLYNETESPFATVKFMWSTIALSLGNIYCGRPPVFYGFFFANNSQMRE